MRSSLTELFWAYSSKTTAQAKQSADKLKEKIYGLIPKRMQTNISRPQPTKELHEYGSALSYEYLLREVCKTMKIDGFNIEPIPTLEVYLIEDLFVKAAAQMNAQQRHAFLTTQIRLDAFATSLPANRSLRSSDDSGWSRHRSRVRLWCLPRSHYRAWFPLSRCWGDLAFCNLCRNDFYDSFSHRPIRVPWSRGMAWVSNSGAGVAAHTSRRPPSNRDEGEVCI